MCFIEVSGEPYVMHTRSTRVIVIPARINANQGTAIEEIEARRKTELINTRNNLAKELERDFQLLQNIFEQCHVFHKNTDKAHKTFKTQVSSALSEFSKDTEEVRAQDASYFNDDKEYLVAIEKAVNFRRGALEKLVEILKSEVSFL
jgi:hypothetical protein